MIKWFIISITLVLVVFYAIAYILYYKDSSCRKKSIEFYRNCKIEVIKENMDTVSSEEEMKMLINMFCRAQLRDTCWYDMEYVFDPSREENHWPVILFGPFLLISQCEERTE